MKYNTICPKCNEEMEFHSSYYEPDGEYLEYYTCKCDNTIRKILVYKVIRVDIETI